MNAYMQDLVIIKARLLHIVGGNLEGDDLGFGLCYHLGNCLPFHTDSHHNIIELMMLWPKHSGSLFYPVPDDTLGYTAMAAYNHHRRNLYDLTTEYGRLRIELAEFLIEELTKLIEKEYDDV